MKYKYDVDEERGTGAISEAPSVTPGTKTELSERKLKIEIEISDRFLNATRKFGLSPKYLAELACELFADNPPAEIRIVVAPALRYRACRRLI